jgi:hypothetical protein
VEKTMPCVKVLIRTSFTILLLIMVLIISTSSSMADDDGIAIDDDQEDEPNDDDGDDDAIQDAIDDDRIGGEVSVITGDEEHDIATEEYDDDLNITVDKVEKDDILITVSSTNQTGRVVLINLTGDFIKAGGRTVVTMDGNEVNMTDSTLDVLYAQDYWPDKALCSIKAQGSGYLVMLYVPSFSTHIVKITSVLPVNELLSPMALVAEAGTIAILVAAAIVMFRKR